ncbi:hypothetical protein RIF29_30451 [Crotalaria pallida]|uniref:Uncharacterized protein n=1 Tax=Crotalaria pallida TaxID=3830 RepID=A0AAN9EN30_CROPI
MLASLNALDRIHESIQESPAASNVPPPINVDDVVPMTSRERGGIGRIRRCEEAVEHRQQIPEDRQPGMYYGYMPSPQSYGYAPMAQMQGFNTPSPYDPVTSTPSAPGRWEHNVVSPNIDFYDIAGSSAPGIDLNTQLFDESTSQDVNVGVRRNPHRGARDQHWRCGT